MSWWFVSLFAGVCSSDKVDEIMSTGLGSENYIRRAFTKTLFFSSEAGATVQCIIVGFLDVS
jgi:hypothetical protein